jgi:hypothetical protein
MILIKVGKLQHVVADEIAAVGWSGPQNCPVITLKSNVLVYCIDYSTAHSVQRAKKLQALLDTISEQWKAFTSVVLPVEPDVAESVEVRHTHHRHPATVDEVRRCSICTPDL